MTPRERFINACSGAEIEEVSVAPFLKATACEIAQILIKKYCTDGEAHAEAQLRCARHFGVDSVNVASDVLIEAEAMGSKSVLLENDFPKLVEPALDTMEVEELRIPDVTSEGRFPMKIEAVRRLKNEEFAVIAWVMSAYQLAAQLRGFKKMIVDLMRKDPKVNPLLEKCLKVSEEYAKVLVEEGADVISIGNASSSMDVLSPRTYLENLSQYDERLSKAIRRSGALVQMHICGNTSPILDVLDRMVDIVDVDHKVSIDQAVRSLSRSTLKGNLDPAVLRFGTPEEVAGKTRGIVEEVLRMKRDKLFVFCTGCEVPPETPHENVAIMVRSAREAWSRT